MRLFLGFADGDNFVGLPGAYDDNGGNLMAALVNTTVSVSVSPAWVLEDGTTNLVYTFTRAGVTTDSLTANFDVGGTATLTTDFAASGATTFTGTTGTVTFGPGVTTVDVTVDPVAGTRAEPDETVLLTVTTATGYTLGSPIAATGTITNDDVAGLTLTVASPRLCGGSLEAGTTSLAIAFSEAVLGGGTAGNYQLQSLGPDALLGTADDTIVAISASYSGTTATLSFTALPESVYRLTVRDTITDVAGNRLDGDKNGTPGGDSREEFAAAPTMQDIFVAAVPYASGGSWPFSVASGDFNADGKTDLAIANGNTSGKNIGILLGNGVGGFAAAVTYDSGGAVPDGLVVGDFNSDGKSDLAVANQNSDNVGVLIGNGAGGFAAAVTYLSGGSFPRSVTVGDFDGDGNSDLAVANYWSESVSVLLGNGVGGFSTAVSYNSGGNNPQAVISGDFNGDGKSDLAVANSNAGNIGILLGNGVGGFAAAVTYLSGGPTPRSVTVGDFSGDGKSDLAIADSSSNNVGILLGNGAGGFSAALSYASGGSRLWSVAVGDFNADGNSDLAVANNSSQSVGILLGNGAGGFGDARIYYVGGDAPCSITLGDFNSDGRSDLAVANASSGNVGVLLNAYRPGVRELDSPHGTRFAVQTRGFGAGQLVEATGNVFDGAGRLEVAGQSYAPTSVDDVQADGNRTVITPTVTIAELYVSREITVPANGTEDFARTLDSFRNPTGSSITTTVRIVGNLGSNAATTVWKTSDGDTAVEITDQWIGTDDADGTGTSAIIHYIHGPAGLVPASVSRSGDVGDNIEWTYNLTVPAGQTVRLAHYTILADTRAAAEAAAAVLIGVNGFGGQAALFLAPAELNSLANFGFNQPPTDLSLSGETVAENLPAETLVGSFSTADPDAGDTFTYALAAGLGDTDNGSFVIAVAGNQLKTAASFDYETKNTYSIRVRTTDAAGLSFEKVFSITVTDVLEAGFALSKTTVTVSEPNTTDTFTVVLRAAPFSDVVFSVVASDGTEATVDKATLTFTPANWNTAQTVTITAVDDVTVDGAVTSTVTVSVVDASSDNAWDPLTDQAVSVTTNDNDVAVRMPVIDVGDHVLLAGEANQRLYIEVSGGDQVQGVELFLQVVDGGPEAGGVVEGPSITAVDILGATGYLPTMFTGNNSDEAGSGSIYPQFWQSGTTTRTGTVAASGLLATAVIDATGFTATDPNNPFALKLRGTIMGDTSFGLVDAAVTNGRLILKNKPTAITTSVSVPEGGTVILNAASSHAWDPNDTIVAYEWDLDGDGVFGETGAAALFGDEVGVAPAFSAAGLDGPSSMQITLRVKDSNYAQNPLFVSTDFTATVSVLDVLPTIALAGADRVAEGATYTLTLGTITDPGPDTVTQWTVHWGDGTSDTYTSGGDKTHVYADDHPAGTASDPCTITADLTDEDGTHAGAGTKGIAVDNVAPNLLPDSLPTQPVRKDQVFALPNVTFTDPGLAADVYTATINWGDGSGDTPGTVIEPTSGTPGTVAGSHTYTANGDYTITVTIQDDDLGQDTLSFTVQSSSSQVVDRSVFYNNSYFDGNNLAANLADFNAIAPHTSKTGGHGPHPTGKEELTKELGKDALLPGQTATWVNYTNFSKGLNGIMVDIAGLAGTLTAADFQFKIGNTNDPTTWTIAPAPTSITVFAGKGTRDAQDVASDRITLIWADKAIQKTWLQVTVLATANTGLANPDVFYFGNAVGESGAGNTLTHTFVTVTDELAARNYPHNIVNRALVSDPYDYSKDSFVTVTDELLARNNATNITNALRLIVAPALPAGGGGLTAFASRDETAMDRSAMDGVLGGADGDGVQFVPATPGSTAAPLLATPAFANVVLPSAGRLLDGLPNVGFSAVKPSIAREHVFTQLERGVGVHLNSAADVFAVWEESLTLLAARKQDRALGVSTLQVLLVIDYINRNGVGLPIGGGTGGEGERVGPLDVVTPALIREDDAAATILFASISSDGRGSLSSSAAAGVDRIISSESANVPMAAKAPAGDGLPCGSLDGAGSKRGMGPRIGRAATLANAAQGFDMEAFELEEAISAIAGDVAAAWSP